MTLTIQKGNKTHRADEKEADCGEREKKKETNKQKTNERTNNVLKVYDTWSDKVANGMAWNGIKRFWYKLSYATIQTRTD